MDRLPPLDLFHRSAKILRDVAQFYVSNNPEAVRARRKVNKTGVDPFHASVLSHLSLLSSLLGQSPNNVEFQSEDIQGAVAETLDVLNSLIYDVPEELTGWPYPGLCYLQSRYRADQIETRRPKPLGYRMYLYCPSLENRQRLKIQLQSCCEVLEKATSKASDTPSILSEIDNIQEWKLAPGLTRHPERLQNLLRNYWHCSCKEPHEDPKVAFIGRTAASRDNDKVSGSYRICFSQATEPPQLWHATNLLLVNREESSRSTNAVYSGKSVRFSGITVEEDWQIVRTLCEAFVRDRLPCSIRLAETKLETKDIDCTQNSSLRSLVSLRTSLAPDSQEPMQKIGRKDRIVLGVVLCYIYLHLSGTSWWKQHDVRPNFWFAKADSRINGFQTRQPFLNFATENLEIRGSNVEKFMNWHRPSLPALGKLLLEIWKGSEVDWKDLEATIEECSKDDTGDYWLCAINTCLGADEALKAAGNLREEEHMRSIYVLKVIKSLQWLLEKVCRLSIEDAFAVATEDKPVWNIPTKPRPDSYASRRHFSLRLPAATNKMCLHDDGQKWEVVSETHAAAAEVWMELLGTQMHQFMPSGGLTEPVRIAIVDTGVAFDKKTALMYKNRICGFRTWVGVQDRKNGMPKTWEDDIDGHGTHSVSTLLRVDPFCKVYVAKVFEGRNQKQGAAMEQGVQERVADAIKYCIHTWKVNVISLSFGFNEHVDSINKAISEAEIQNVVVFAAASNCGGNDDASWPANHPTVIRVYATDGYGNKYPRNPTPQDGEDNFATLGMEVKAWWQPGSKAHRSGTSIATPITAGIASLIVHFLRKAKSTYLSVNDIDTRVYESRLQRLLSYSAMRKVLRLMVNDRDGYDYIEPWKLLSSEAGSVHGVADRLLKTIKKA